MWSRIRLHQKSSFFSSNWAVGSFLCRRGRWWVALGFWRSFGAPMVTANAWCLLAPIPEVISMSQESWVWWNDLQRRSNQASECVLWLGGDQFGSSCSPKLMFVIACVGGTYVVTPRYQRRPVLTPVDTMQLYWMPFPPCNWKVLTVTRCEINLISDSICVQMKRALLDRVRSTERC